MNFPSAQSAIASAQAGKTVRLDAGDYGPLAVDKPLTLEGAGACLWGDGPKPALEIRSPEVAVRNLVLRWSTPGSAPHRPPTVLSVHPGSRPGFHNVKIHGGVSGLSGESGPWRLPSSLHLGDITTAKAVFTMELAVPVPCRLTTQISGLDFDLPVLVPGICHVRLRVRDLTPDSLLAGYIEVVFAQLSRLIPLFGRVLTFSTTTTPAIRNLVRIPSEQRKNLLRPEQRTTAPEPKKA